MAGRNMTLRERELSDAVRTTTRHAQQMYEEMKFVERQLLEVQHQLTVATMAWRRAERRADEAFLQREEYRASGGEKD